MDANILKIVELTQKISQDENNADYRLERAEILISMMQIDEALNDIDFVIEHNEGNAKAYILRGTIRMQQGNKAGAAEDMKKAVELDPNIINNLDGKFSV